jgi:hypothetical protein
MKYLVLCAAILLSGCATVQFNGAESQVTKIDQPPIGQVVTASIGDRLLQKGEIVQQNVLQVNHTIDGVAYDIPQGVYRGVGHDAKSDFYTAVGVVKSFIADPPKALMLGKAPGSELCVVTIFGGKACYSGDFERKNQVSERGTSFQQTLIYSGRVGDKIKVSYREFSNDMARPAFNNDVEYDLSVSNIIGYKGARIEVLKADNTSITYRVISSFN